MLEIIKTDLSKNLAYLKPVINIEYFNRLIRTSDKQFFLVMEARNGDLLVGALLANVFPAIHSTILQSFFILPDFQGQGAGTQLFDQFVHELKQQKIGVVNMTTPPCAFFEKRFPDGEPLIKRYHFDVKQFHPDWFEKKYALGKGFRTFSWTALTEEEKTFLKNRLERRRIDEDISPFGDEGILEPLNSMGLRYDGRVVGWMVTHRVAEDTLRYTALYIEEEFRYKGTAAVLLNKAIRRQQASNIKWATFEVHVTLSDEHWLRFVNVRLAPYAQKKEDLFVRNLLLKY